MSGRTRRLWSSAAAGVIAVVTVAGLVAVWRSSQRAELEAFAALVIPVASLAAAWIAGVWRPRGSRGSEVVSGLKLTELADRLAGAVDQQWKLAAGERGLLEPEPIPVQWRQSAAPLAGRVADAVASERFAPLPGLAAAGEQQIRAGQVSELHDVYGGLGSGRLVIAGGPGAGKSSAAVLLILAAIRHRRSVPDEIRPEVPVPVMFTLHEWDPSTQRARDWLVERLCQDYPLFGGRQGAGMAQAMLDQNQIAVILDGLDEIPENLRPDVLRVLNEEATFRLVLLTRSAEMAGAAARAKLHGAAAIELQPIDPGAAADYLTRTQLDPLPQGWQKLTSRLRQEPGGPLARALSNPLMLTLVRDTYSADGDVGELLGLREVAGYPASSQTIADHLVDRVLPTAYTQLGKAAPRYDLPTAERTLRYIAKRMNKDGTRDLQWWHVPAWAPAVPRVIATCLGVGLVAGLVVGLVAELTWGVTVGLADGIVAGIWTAFAAGFAFGRGNKIPRQMASIRWRELFRRRPLAVGLLAGAVTGIVFAVLGIWGTLGRHLEMTLRDALGLGLATGVVAWLVAGLVAGMSRPGTDNTSPLSPRSSWRSDRAFGLVVGLVVGLVTWLVVWLVIWLWAGIVVAEFRGFYLVAGLVVGFAAGFAAGVVTGLVYPQSWSSFLVFVQLAVSDRTPVRLIRFLEDARRRSVLRTVGPVYQFRHARLQDRLAAWEPATAQGPSEPRPAAGGAAAPTTKAPPASAI